MFLPTIGLLVLGVAIAAIGARLLLASWHRHRTPPELRGDWWARFEGGFRAYTEFASKADRKGKPQARGTRSPPR